MELDFDVFTVLVLIAIYLHDAQGAFIALTTYAAVVSGRRMLGKSDG